jgi:hypothetical protein
LAEGYLRGEADAAARADSGILPKGHALPAAYIDPEGKNADGQLLEVFCRACGGHPDVDHEMLLRGIRGVRAFRFTSHPFQLSLAEVQLLTEALNFCTGNSDYRANSYNHYNLLQRLKRIIKWLNEEADGTTTTAQPPNALPARILTMCKKRGWDLSWSSRGVYLHLEASELIEALRGKHGDPLSEAADVLLVLMSITENAGIPWCDVLNQTAMTCARLEVCDPYPGEERGALTQSESEQIPPGPHSEQDLDAKAWAFIDKQAKWGDPAAQSLVDMRELAPLVTQPAAPPANGKSEYTNQEWAEIYRWGQSDVVAQPASPVLPAGGSVNMVVSAMDQSEPGQDGFMSENNAARAAILAMEAAWLDLLGYECAANDLRGEAGR